MWKSYLPLTQEGYIHQQVNHKKNFVERKSIKREEIAEENNQLKEENAHKRIKLNIKPISENYTHFNN